MTRLKLLSLYKRKTQSYLKDTGGNIAPITAMIGLPLILAVGYSLDMNRATSNEVIMKGALDSAALAAVIPADLTIDERKAYAVDVFNKNHPKPERVTLSVEATREQVSVTGTIKTESLVGGIAGGSGITNQERSTAVLTQQDVICLLALDPDGRGAVEYRERAEFKAPNCTVQVNSTNKEAIISSVDIAPVAKSFCVVGGSKGDFAPRIKNDCSPVEDPFASLVPPINTPCIDMKKLQGGNAAALTFDTLDTLSGTSELTDELLDIVGDNTVLFPGTYCGGLEIKGLNVRFMPGTYIMMDKKLKFKSFASAYGNNVTFVFKTHRDALEIEGSSHVVLKAPKFGDYEGIVFYQTKEGAKGPKPKIDKKTGEIEPPKTGRTKITTGGGLKVVGSIYLPDQEVEISSDSPVASNSPSTSFIAKRFLFQGDSITNVDVSLEAGMSSPLLPRSDDGARLVE